MIFQNIEFESIQRPLFEPKLYLKGLLYHKNILLNFAIKVLCTSRTPVGFIRFYTNHQ
jgi:hypothetical protein